jgi:hypothetical protein
MANDEGKEKWFLPLFGGMVVVTVALAIIIGIYVSGDAALKLKLAIGYGSLVLVFLYGFAVLAAIASDKIDISELLEEETGGASTSRFQLVIFTFVIGLSFVLIVATTGKFPDLPANVLALLGISATTYGVSKGIQAGAQDGSSKDGSHGTSPSTNVTVTGDPSKKV